MDTRVQKDRKNVESKIEDSRHVKKMCFWNKFGYPQAMSCHCPYVIKIAFENFSRIS